MDLGQAGSQAVTVISEVRQRMAVSAGCFQGFVLPRTVLCLSRTVKWMA